MTFAIYNVNTGEILDEVEDAGDAWDRLVDIEDETDQDCAIKAIETDLGFATMSGKNKEAERLNVARHLKLIEIKHLEADLV
jgi:hypothetical protein